MPYTNYHSVRINDPGKYKKFRWDKDKFKKDAIEVLWGITDEGKTEIQALRFNKKKFSPAEAKKWATDHGYKVKRMEKAKSESFITFGRYLQEARGPQKVIKGNSFKGDDSARDILQKHGFTDIDDKTYSEEIVGTAPDGTRVIYDVIYKYDRHAQEHSWKLKLIGKHK